MVCIKKKKLLKPLPTCNAIRPLISAAIRTFIVLAAGKVVSSFSFLVLLDQLSNDFLRFVKLAQSIPERLLALVLL